MKTFSPVLPACLLVAVLSAPVPDAPAQIGSREDAWGRSYGRPLSESTEGSIRTLAFRKEGMDIVLDGRTGTCRRATYRKAGLTAREIKRLLDQNKEAALWSEWIPPGRAEIVSLSTLWRRSDSQALAVMKGDTLTITAAGWEEEAPSEPVVVAIAPVPKAAPEVPATPLSRPVKPRLKPPAALPNPGDSRSRVLTILGGPMGQMLSGEREIWVYAWGHILLENGLFVKVDDRVFTS